MINNETVDQRKERILNMLEEKYPGKDCFDLDGRGMHFVCEVEPTVEHPEYDVAIEVMLLTKPHKHLKMTQCYTILKGTLELHVGDEIINMRAGDKQVIYPGSVHWAKSEDECMAELRSEPGWTKEDHILVNL